MAVLEHRFIDAPRRAHVGLTPFQEDAVGRLSAILERRQGAILADSVGLGKTLVARELIQQAVEASGNAVVCAPAALRRHWTRHLAGVRRWTWISHTSLSRRGTKLLRRNADLIVVDEAHAFRNANTRRYRALAALATHARLLLLTATPVNNALEDFYNLVRLFVARDAFMDVDVPDLLGAIESAATGHDLLPVRRVVEQVTVRRTRAIAEQWQQVAQPRHGDLTLRFPKRARVERLHYNLEDAYPELMPRLVELLPAIRFTAHGVEGNAAAPQLLRLTLVKRLESSAAAFVDSLRYHIRILEYFVAAAEQGLLFLPRLDRDIVRDVDGALQLPFSHLLLRPWPQRLAREQKSAAAVDDLRMVGELYALITPRAPEPKLCALRELVRHRFRDDKIIVFTEYRETATYLWQQLCYDTAVALIHGGDARLGRSAASRTFVIDRFAPVANRARAPRAHQRVQMLIATDVLAEGMNLQDARVVVSYDLPWNPVKLTQRVGRVDRLGSPHPAIEAIAFWPDRGIEELLGIVRRIRVKLRAIRAVGGDSPHLDTKPGRPRRDRITVTDDAAWDALERLRCEFLRRREAYGAEIMARGTTILTTAVEWEYSYSYTLCCFACGPAVRFVGSRAGKREEVSASIADPLLLRALDAPMLPLLDDTRLQCTGRESRRLLMPAPLSSKGAGAARRRIGAALRTWAQDRAAELCDADIAALDHVLTGVAADGSVEMEIVLRRLLRRRGPAGELLAELHRVIHGGSAGNGPTVKPAEQPRPNIPRAPRLIAVLTFRPEMATSGPQSAPLGTASAG